MAINRNRQNSISDSTKELNFSGRHLIDEQWATVINALNQNPTVTSINLSDNYFTYVPKEFIAAVRSHANLESVNMTGNGRNHTYKTEKYRKQNPITEQWEDHDRPLWQPLDPADEKKIGDAIKARKLDTVVPVIESVLVDLNLTKQQLSDDDLKKLFSPQKDGHSMVGTLINVLNALDNKEDYDRVCKLLSDDNIRKLENIKHHGAYRVLPDLNALYKTLVNIYKSNGKIVNDNKQTLKVVRSHMENNGLIPLFDNMTHSTFKMLYTENLYARQDESYEDQIQDFGTGLMSLPPQLQKTIHLALFEALSISITNSKLPVNVKKQYVQALEEKSKEINKSIIQMQDQQGVPVEEQVQQDTGEITKTLRQDIYLLQYKEKIDAYINEKPKHAEINITRAKQLKKSIDDAFKKSVSPAEAAGKMVAMYFDFLNVLYAQKYNQLRKILLESLSKQFGIDSTRYNEPDLLETIKKSLVNHLSSVYQTEIITMQQGIYIPPPKDHIIISLPKGQVQDFHAQWKKMVGFALDKLIPEDFVKLLSLSLDEGFETRENILDRLKKKIEDKKATLLDIFAVVEELKEKCASVIGQNSLEKIFIDISAKMSKAQMPASDMDIKILQAFQEKRNERPNVFSMFAKLVAPDSVTSDSKAPETIKLSPNDIRVQWRGVVDGAIRQLIKEDLGKYDLFVSDNGMTETRDEVLKRLRGKVNNSEIETPDILAVVNELEDKCDKPAVKKLFSSISEAMSSQPPRLPTEEIRNLIKETFEEKPEKEPQNQRKEGPKKQEKSDDLLSMFTKLITPDEKPKGRPGRGSKQ